MEKKKRIVIALGGNALGNTLPEPMKAVKITSRAIVDLIQEGCEVVVAHGNGPQVGMVNNAMIALTHEDPQQPNTPLSVCVAMSQAYIGYDLQNALREELLNRGITDIPVATMITQVRVDPDDPAFEHPSKPIGRFMTKEQADFFSMAVQAATSGNSPLWSKLLQGADKLSAYYVDYLLAARKNADFVNCRPMRVLVTATMSAGKSTLINALTGKKIRVYLKTQKRPKKC